MKASLPPSDAAGGAYSLVAWPPEALDTWLRRIQERLAVRGFGVPHLNIRTPFHTDIPRAELIDRFRDVLAGATSFEVEIAGWKRYPNVIFLECRPSARLLYLHLMALGIGPSTRSRFDGESFTPHLTLALGVLPWAEDALWQEVVDLQPPLQRFTVSALSLTAEQHGEVQELHTYPLQPLSLPGLAEGERPS
ncbi:2'-5' RNA ligase family protein [Deinococcus lacus]|uniref:2'-5' RNA ligase family protein n=1 Tax=Deinococcus lacus TaxID=392561 RepID=A0ABW1YCX1_9DEIO